MSDDFQAEIAFLGIASSPAFVRGPEGNGCIERFFRTLKQQLLWVRDFTTLENLARHSKNSASGTTTTGCWKGSASNPRGRLVKGCLPLRLLHDDNQKNCPRNRVRYNFRLRAGHRPLTAPPKRASSAGAQFLCPAILRAV
jgi:hypothetical protein